MPYVWVTSETQAVDRSEVKAKPAMSWKKMRRGNVVNQTQRNLTRIPFDCMYMYIMFVKQFVLIWRYDGILLLLLDLMSGNQKRNHVKTPVSFQMFYFSRMCSCMRHALHMVWRTPFGGRDLGVKNILSPHKSLTSSYCAMMSEYSDRSRWNDTKYIWVFTTFQMM